MFWIVLNIVCFILFFLSSLFEFGLALRDRKFQKLWDKEKAMRLRIDPNISRADLCEQYVMFCKRNDCRVEF